MKTLKTLSLMLLSGMALSGFAQTGERLKLSTLKPEANKKITFTYDTTGAALGGVPEATVHFIGKTYSVDDIVLTADGKKFKGSFNVPASAKGFYLRFANADNIDANNGKGYLYEIYKGGKPVEGAYAAQAYVISTGMGKYFAKIEADKERAASLYKNEFSLYPASEKAYLQNYMVFLSSLKTPESKAQLDAKVATLKNTTDEENLKALSFWHRVIQRKNSAADSVDAIIVAKFPNGETAKAMAGKSIFTEKDAVKKDSLLKVFLAKYPDNEENKGLIDNYRMQVAIAYMQAGNDEVYQKYAPLFKTNINLAAALNNTTFDWAQNNKNLDLAAKYSKQSLDIMDAAYATQATDGFYPPKQVKANNRSDYYNYVDTYAFILYRQGKYQEALKYQQLAYDSERGKDPEIKGHYALILIANGQNAKAKGIFEELMRAGQGNAEIKSELKKIYIKEKGNEDGFTTYLSSLDVAAKNKKREELAKTMINEPAPVFTLKDFDGNAVSLADLKGKVVVLDFWATWCGPCKASFPGMQIAVNNYKDNPNVKFLFIDTWENGDNFLPGVKKFIADNNYSFHVLVDEKAEDGSQSKVVSSYKVEGIPTKFVIDQSGNIRFKHVGFSGSADGVVNEVTAMIDMLAKPEGANQSGEAKVSGR